MTQARIDPDVLRAATPKFKTAADELKQAMDTLFAGGQGEGASGVHRDRRLDRGNRGGGRSRRAEDRTKRQPSN